MYGEKKKIIKSSNSKKSVAVSTLTQTCDALRTQMKIIKKRTYNIGLKITQKRAMCLWWVIKARISEYERESFTTMWKKYTIFFSQRRELNIEPYNVDRHHNVLFPFRIYILSLLRTTMLLREENKG